MYISHQIIQAYMVYMLTSSSIGPTNLVIIREAIDHGKTAGLFIGLGVMTGAMIWGVLASLQLLLISDSSLMMAIVKALGSVYLLWLIYKVCVSKLPQINHNPINNSKSPVRTYLSGIMIHLTNPKAVVTWVIVTTIGLESSLSSQNIIILLAGCFLIGTCICSAYALLFSLKFIKNIYYRFFLLVKSITVALLLNTLFGFFLH